MSFGARLSEENASDVFLARRVLQICNVCNSDLPSAVTFCDVGGGYARQKSA
jgi:hypothetical protein